MKKPSTENTEAVPEKTPTLLVPEECYAALLSRDSRFDGVFFVAVSTTKIYCRPICRVRVPKAERCTFYHNAASAEQAGYRPCLRCRPELAPGNAAMDAVKRIAHLAAARIKAGALSDNSVEELAAEFGISDRHLRRVIESEYGVSPIDLAQTYRLLLAKQLLTDTDLKITDVAFTSGFSSVRRFNHAFKNNYRLNPSELRKSLSTKEKNKKVSQFDNGIILRLSYRPPLAWKTLISYLCSRGNSRVDKILINEKGEEIYYKTISLSSSLEKDEKEKAVTGWISASLDEAKHQIIVTMSPSLLPHLMLVQSKIRDLLDLDANPMVIEDHLCRDKALKKLITKNRGVRVAGTIDGFDLALRAVLGQQISVKAATTVYGRFVDAFGDDVETPIEGLDKTSPNPVQIANTPIEKIISLGLTQRRATTVKELAIATVNGSIPWDSGQNEIILQQLLALPGIGPWTGQYVAMRGLKNPNAFPESDLGLMKALNVKKPRDVLERAKKWAPWRAYGAIYCWDSLSSGG